MVKKSSKKDELQPEINIGLVGHVDHGKTTLTEQLSGKWTDTHSEELKRGITIRLGYADATFYKCTKCGKYTSHPKCMYCMSDCEPIRKVSFVDAPGHESLMATMLAGASIMDGALLLIAANESCPQPQTREHLMALEIAGIKNVVIVQNKIDLIKEDEATKNYEEIKEFLKGTSYEKSPIVPISAQHGANIDLLIETIQEYIPTPKRDTKQNPMMYIARSFDINKPGITGEKIVGGIIGGAVFQGTLTVGSKIELKPGREIERQGKKVYIPITTNIISINTGGTKVDSATPGGSIGIMTDLDPSIVKSDMLTGNLVGLPGTLPETLDRLRLKTVLLERIVGAKDDLVVDIIKKKEILMLNVNAAATVGIVQDISKEHIDCTLKRPICAAPGSKVTISRRVGNRWRLIGYGLID